MSEVSHINKNSSEIDFNWMQYTVISIALVIFILLIFFDTSYSMVEIWWRSETFAHGFLIFPIVIWLIWRKRKDVVNLIPQANLWGLPALLILGFLWFIADAVDINVVRQAAMVAMIPVTIFTFLGWQVTKTLLFPLLFVMFAVPVGEGLIPPLMDFTADFTVGMVQLTGIPVYREGTFFELPTGNWSVVEGCSGVRYLIASITLGCLYAYLTYTSYIKRTVFIAFSIIMPILANGLRAFIIVMLGHFSDMKIATGVDHLIYGWVFFGFVIAIMFYIGSFWRDEEIEKNSSEEKSDTINSTKLNKRGVYLAASLIIFSTVLWPASAMVRNSQSSENILVNLITPSSNLWKKSESKLTEWQPRYLGTDAKLEQTYVKNGQKVSLFLGYYIKQRQDKELVNTQNYLIEQKHEIWALKGKGAQSINLNGEAVVVKDGILRSNQQSLYVQYWYWLNGKYTSSPTKAKLMEAKNILTGGSKPAAVIAVTTEMDETIVNAKPVVEMFTAEMLPAIEKSLSEALDN